LSQWTLKSAGRSFLVCAGFAWGVWRIVKAGSRDAENSAEWDEIGLRLGQIEQAIEKIAASAVPETSQGQGDFVTREELKSGLAAAESRIEKSVDAKFEVQSLSIGALKAMVSQTDALLERVLVALEAGLDETEQDEIVERDSLLNELSISSE
jgi:hypothetical protein